ncbi:restriction endonuclease subunit S [Faecalibacterium prausnitzii]|uniref:restriction endonuclease subunit S n=1 Tax=Faecalibacterium prausnitzii TaxID=853 RepID=UPI001CBAFF74|nr:restriction endonuclease subunit S [Faecalibacterium prausnitzii]
MGEWKNVRVGELGKIITGKTPKTSISDNYGGRIPFLTPSDNMSVKYVGKTSKTLTEKGLLEVKNAILPENSVCVSCIGSDLGKAVITTCPTVTNQQINSIIVDEKSFDVSFVYYAMQILGKKMNFISKTSTAVPIVNKSSFSSYEIKCPPREDQKRIAAVLSALDSKIECNKKINDNLEQQAVALFKSWFVDFSLFGGTVPENWDDTTLENITTLITRGIAPKYSDNSDQTVVNQKCIRNHTIDLSLARTHTPKAINEKWLKFGDLLINSTGDGTLGRVAQVWFAPKALTVDSHVTIVRPAREELIFYIGLWGILHEKEIESLHTGSTGQTELPRDRVKMLKLLLPDDSSLSRFNSIIAPMTSTIISNQEENQKLANLRDTLLPKLMSGVIDVANVQL